MCYDNARIGAPRNECPFESYIILLYNKTLHSTRGHFLLNMDELLCRKYSDSSPDISECRLPAWYSIWKKGSPSDENRGLSSTSALSDHVSQTHGQSESSTHLLQVRLDGDISFYDICKCRPIVARGDLSGLPPTSLPWWQTSQIDIPSRDSGKSWDGAPSCHRLHKFWRALYLGSRNYNSSAFQFAKRGFARAESALPH